MFGARLRPDNDGRGRLPYSRGLSGRGSRVIFDLARSLGSHCPEFAFSAGQVYSSRSQPFDLRDYAIRKFTGQ